MTKSRGLREHHGQRHLKEYGVWCAMRGRCYNPYNSGWADYGGRGIAVCDAWAFFSQFYADMGPRPEGGMLERNDNEMDYEPNNCRWATRREQNLNKRSNVLVSIDGETHPLSVWVERCGLKYTTVHRRITKYGWPPVTALTTPLITKRKGVPRGHKLFAWGAEHGVIFHDPAVASEVA